MKNDKQQKTTAFAPRQTPSRPLTALFLIAFGLLALVSLSTYQPGQPYFLQESLLKNFSQSTQIIAPNPVGKLGATLATLLNCSVGIAGWLVPFFMLWLGYLCLCRKAHLIRPWKIAAMVLSVLSGAALVSLLQQAMHPSAESIAEFKTNIFVFGWGGWMGASMYYGLLRENLGNLGTFVIFFLMSVAAMTVSFVESPTQMFDGLHQSFAAWRERRREAAAARRAERKALRKALEEEKKLRREKQPEATSQPVVEPPRKRRIVLNQREEQADEEPADEAEAKSGTGRRAKDAAIVPPKPEPEPQPEPAASDAASGPVGPVTVIAPERVEKSSMRAPRRKSDFKFPPLNLLAEVEEGHEEDTAYLQNTFDDLVRTLEEFKIKVFPAEIHTGPVITRYEVTPAPGVRVEKIEGLEKNIALALKALAVRVLAPVPGKGTVGIEVPNRRPQSVCLREIIESKVWQDSTAEIPIVLGKDVTGKPIVADLTKMPHCLIAGSTGSGKTVCINAIIASLLYRSSPDELRFIMVDPKVVEMQEYNSLPHMLIPVVTDPKRVPGALKWLIAEMERRYQIFARVGVRNIAGFNAKILKDKAEEERARQLEAEMTAEERAAAATVEVPRDDDALEIPNKKLPYIVCIIDELADLMMVAPADIETGVARLAQLARAAGIHLILATQRPSVNVITGVIKANLPTRIAFKVASKIDSRTILDQNGADSLIGKGDMLFIPPGTSNLVRAQGAFVSDDEIKSIVEFLKKNGPPEFAEDVQRQIEADDGDGDSGSDGGGEWEDDLVPAAIEVLRASKRASTSMLQRRLKIGYNRAARIMEILEDEGIVGPENGSSPREILKDLDML